MDKIQDYINAFFGKQTIGHITLKNVLIFVGILIAGRIVFVLFKRFILKNFFKRRGVDIGRQYSLTSLIKYFYYIMLFVFALQFTGVNLSILLTAGAALMVGVGIGLQQMFSDLISGIILLFEGSIEKGDWVEIGDTEGVVIKIGLRTSLVETRNGIAIIVPNSDLTAEKVVNLSHHKDTIRYIVEVGVSYKADPKMVHDILLEVTKGIEAILQDPKPLVRLTEFADSSINYEILFWSSEYRSIADVKSKLRFAISDVFKANDIEIPFPQRDLNIKLEDTKTLKENLETKKLDSEASFKL
jgi:small-conductance mechanosensitive channel